MISAGAVSGTPVHVRAASTVERGCRVHGAVQAVGDVILAEMCIDRAARLIGMNVLGVLVWIGRFSHTRSAPYSLWPRFAAPLELLRIFGGRSRATRTHNPAP